MRLCVLPCGGSSSAVSSDRSVKSLDVMFQRAIRPDLQLVAPFLNRLICHQVQQAGTVCISMDAVSLSYVLGGSELHAPPPPPCPFWVKWSAKS